MFAGAMWFWHSPAPYAATFANPWVYWLMHVSTFGSALLLWRVLIDQRHQMVTGISAGAVSTLQMTFLGAIITLTPHALYSQHMLTPLQWGMTQITDQQLGGLLMWVPGCTVFLAVTLLGLGRALSDRTPTNLEAVDI